MLGCLQNFPDLCVHCPTLCVQCPNLCVQCPTLCVHCPNLCVLGVQSCVISVQICVSSIQTYVFSVQICVFNVHTCVSLGILKISVALLQNERLSQLCYICGHLEKNPNWKAQAWLNVKLEIFAAIKVCNFARQIIWLVFNFAGLPDSECPLQ